MIKVSFFYPYRENARFDIDYYCKSHMPWVAGLLDSELLPPTAVRPSYRSATFAPVAEG
jgi:hypothetical protein